MNEQVTTVDISIEPASGYQQPRRPQLHFSGLDKLWGCGEAFRRIYIEKERPDANAAILAGIAVDRSVTMNLEHKILNGALLPLEEIKDKARDVVESEWKKRTIVMTADERAAGESVTRGAVTDKAVRLAALHAKEVAPKINPIHVARKWSIEIPGFPFDLVGEIDVQEKEGPRDTKTSGKSPVSNIADLSDQLTTYDIAIMVLDGKAPDRVTLDYLVDNKTPVAKTFTSTRNNADRQVLMNRVANAADAIQKGAFVPAQPTDWRCSIKWCGFAPTCPYFKQPKSVVIETGE